MSSKAQNDEERCESVAWHGDRCKNKRKNGQPTCAWHAPNFAENARASRIQADTVGDITNPRTWNVQCKAKRISGDHKGERCGRNAIRGLDLCTVHGGGHPAAREMGRRVMENRQERHKLDKLRDKYGLDEVNPLQAMQKLVSETLAMKDVLFEEITNMRDQGWSYEDRLGIEQSRQVFQQYERAVDRTGKLLADLNKLNIDDRLAKISERQADMVAVVLGRVLAAMELSEDRRLQAQTLLSTEFKKMELVQDSETA